jgi:hypothetical protein
MLSCTGERKKQTLINLDNWVLLVKLENKLKLIKITNSYNNNLFLELYAQHKLIYPYLEKENIHCFFLPFLNVSMLSTKYENYNKLVSSLSDLTKIQLLVDNNKDIDENLFYKKDNNYQDIRELNNNIIDNTDNTISIPNKPVLEESTFIKKDDVPPSNHYDNVMEMKDFDNKFLDSNKKSYYVYLNKDIFKAYLLDLKLETSYFPELKMVTKLELDMNLYTKYKEILNDYLYYDEIQVMSIIGNNNLSFLNLRERFNLLFEKDSDNKMTFDDILNNLIVNIDDIFINQKLISFYTSSLKKLLELNNIENINNKYLLKLTHSDNIVSAKNLLKLNVNNTEAIPVEIFNNKLDTLKNEYNL